MCGRYTFAVDPADLAEVLPGYEFPADVRPRYNIAPTQNVAVVANDGERRVQLFRWGLIPSWAKDPAIGARMINARAETVAEKPSFRAAFKRRRCLVLADGYYEWRKETGGAKKTPFHIRLKPAPSKETRGVQRSRPFAFAGLWETWDSPDGGPLRTCTIITTTPNAALVAIHDRMPVILAPRDYAMWLARADTPPATLAPLLKPYPADEMEAVRVSTFVNNPRNDDPRCIESD
ncbi:MAG: SOS response-associated peptidase [Deltaproteobacteria bacterium]|nr:SOS response-associated peptidase [Deltaproteobacteria bacterium]